MDPAAQPPPPANNPPQPPTTFPLAEFQAGVTACLRSWSAFRTAVEGGWGGGASNAKADTLRQHIYEVMSGRTALPSIDQQDLEDNLIIYLEEEFSVTLEDGSERQVANQLFQLYAECMQGQTALAEQLVGTALRYDQQIAAAYPVQIQSSEHDDDDDDDDDAMMDTTNNNAFGMNVAVASQTPPGQPPQATAVPPVPFTTAADYAAQPLFGKPKKPKAPKQREEPEEIQMDDDGFATVTKSRRKPRP